MVLLHTVLAAAASPDDLGKALLQRFENEFPAALRRTLDVYRNLRLEFLAEREVDAPSFKTHHRIEARYLAKGDRWRLEVFYKTPVGRRRPDQRYFDLRSLDMHYELFQETPTSPIQLLRAYPIPPLRLVSWREPIFHEVLDDFGIAAYDRYLASLVKMLPPHRFYPFESADATVHHGDEAVTLRWAYGPDRIQSFTLLPSRSWALASASYTTRSTYDERRATPLRSLTFHFAGDVGGVPRLHRSFDVREDRHPDGSVDRSITHCDVRSMVSEPIAAIEFDPAGFGISQEEVNRVRSESLTLPASTSVPAPLTRRQRLHAAIPWWIWPVPLIAAAILVWRRRKRLRPRVPIA